MGKIAFYIFYGVNWIITLLPLRILYVFADILFLFLYYCPSYRRDVVATNLKNSFPEKSAEEIAAIEKKFYRHLADIIVETLKLTHLSNEELKRRFKINNPEVLKKLYDSGRDLAAVHSHYNNWEWFACLPLYTDYKTVAIYKPLQNKHFNKFLNSLRMRNNSVMTPMNQVIREIIDNKKKITRTYYGFAADQTPALSDIKYYTDFLNQETPVFLGLEKIAERYDMSVVFIKVQKEKRGFYNLSVELLFEHTKGLPEYLVTNTHVKRLEELIRERPEYWIWTHRRWKYKRQETDG